MMQREDLMEVLAVTANIGMYNIKKLDESFYQTGCELTPSKVAFCIDDD
jgi:hypothetical protein